MDIKNREGQIIFSTEAANLIDADLSNANLSNANLSNANLIDANLRNANLRNANLIDANLSNANLSNANLSNANLSNANLIDANLIDANLSGAKGLLSPSAWLAENFNHDGRGWIVYKSFGEYYSSPADWKIQPGEFLTETVNRMPTDPCGCGVNFGTLEYTKFNTLMQTWKCRIRTLHDDGSPCADIAGVVVPYNTDGKARCERLELVGKYSEEDGSQQGDA